MTSERDRQEDDKAALEQAIKERVAARSDRSLNEIRELTPNTALVVVEQESESQPSLYRIKHAPQADDGEEFTWEYLGETDG